MQPNDPAEAGHPQPVQPQPVQVSERTGRSPRDMALSLAVLLIPIFLLLVVYRFLGGESATVWDPTSTFADARSAGVFQVVEPEKPAGWKPASSSFQRGADGAVLRVGYRGDSDTTAQLVESDLAADKLVPKEIGSGARQVGAIEIDGRDWMRYTQSDRKALVFSEPGRTIIVFGAATDAQLAGLVASLRF